MRLHAAPPRYSSAMRSASASVDTEMSSMIDAPPDASSARSAAPPSPPALPLPAPAVPTAGGRGEFEAASSSMADGCSATRAPSSRRTVAPDGAQRFKATASKPEAALLVRPLEVGHEATSASCHACSSWEERRARRAGCGVSGRGNTTIGECRERVEVAGSQRGEASGEDGERLVRLDLGGGEGGGARRR